ncbi:MAG TPA: response regulator transcription factor [Candidatus Limnocylindria bacterium]|jgi:DNA-binding response OmpR family regulator|nr:response regulator transcription factor [Candidatus Limnocylindria bacterium]
MENPNRLTILVADDEPAWVGALGAVLGQAGHRIVAAYDGEEALRRFHAERVDAVLLDLAMPGLDGAEVCRRMRAESDVPILIVSGERDESAPAELLDLGADDYVGKGTPSTELLARIRAVIRRRAVRPVTPPTADAGDWQLDRRRHEIGWRGRPLTLTVIEFRLLAALIEHRAELVPHGQLLAAGWPGVPDPDPIWLKPHFARLREKLREADAPTPTAVRGVGYRLDA